MIENLTYINSCGVARAVVVDSYIELNVVCDIDVSCDVDCLYDAHIDICYCCKVLDGSIVVCVVGFVFISVYMNRIGEVS